ncbi:cytochrome P450 [Haloarchaeobius sp. DYHT-AS-18]|uniref:cytochrome P450 n=1 Tax=Haloarchaeobius sp. DYHT-AS-18 TaxID=3446117 RepID=UPI003EBABBC2
MAERDPHTPPERPRNARQPGVLSVPQALSTPESWLDPFEWYAEMRETEPVHWDADRECWDVFRHADVSAVLSDPETFSSDPRNASNEAFRRASEDVEMETMLGSDPPKHEHLRGVVEEHFRPRAVADLAPRIEEIAEDCLDDVLADGEMDVVADLAYPLPVIVIAELLGIPSEDRETFKRWSDSLVETPTERTEAAAREVEDRRQQTLDELREYFDDLIDQRKADPGDDLISKVVTAEIEHRPLSAEEMRGFCVLLLVAGNVTTTNLLTNAVWTLTEHPDALARLQSEPTLLTKAVEEVLRYRSPVQALGRVATTDTTLGGQSIRQGDVVVTWVGSANRDPAAFDRPEEFVVDRTPNQHIAFGRGIHYCLGAPLARLESRLALSELLDSVDDIEAVATADQLTPVRSAFIYGVEAFPVRFVAPGSDVRRPPPA